MDISCGNLDNRMQKEMWVVVHWFLTFYIGVCSFYMLFKNLTSSCLCHEDMEDDGLVYSEEEISVQGALCLHYIYFSLHFSMSTVFFTNVTMSRKVILKYVVSKGKK